MIWLKVSEILPADDQNVLIINSRLDYPARGAYYSEEDNLFITLQCGCPFPATHWMPLPKLVGLVE